MPERARTIDDQAAWEIVTRGIPELMPLLRQLLEEAGGEDPPHAPPDARTHAG